MLVRELDGALRVLPRLTISCDLLRLQDRLGSVRLLGTDPFSFFIHFANGDRLRTLTLANDGSLVAPLEKGLAALVRRGRGPRIVMLRRQHVLLLLMLVRILVILIILQRMRQLLPGRALLGRYDILHHARLASFLFLQDGLEELRILARVTCVWMP